MAGAITGSEAMAAQVKPLYPRPESKRPKKAMKKPRQPKKEQK